jgi:xanthine dehydrogenase accessory factor
LFPEGTAVCCGGISEALSTFALRADTYVVSVTRGHEQDAKVLAACVRQPLAYLGMIGSRRKVAMLRREFIESGRATAEEFNRVAAPIGLDIGAITVPEIAASIVAQLIAVRRKGREASLNPQPAP